MNFSIIGASERDQSWLRCLAAMGKMIFRPYLRLRPTSRRNAIVALLGLFLNCAWLLPAPLHALDPNKRISQYVHTSWRVRDGSVLNADLILSTTRVIRFGAEGDNKPEWTE